MRSSDWSSDVCSSDLLVLAFYARATKSEAADGGAHLPNNGVQLAREPYTGIFGGPVAITPEWKMYDLQGIADRDYAAGELSVSMHLASGKQTPEVGPIFVPDLGPAPSRTRSQLIATRERAG